MAIASKTLYIQSNKNSVQPKTLRNWTSALLILQFAVFIVALVVLGSAINWPASLIDPADKVLPLIRQQSGAVALGYSAYCLSALLLFPIALLWRSILGSQAKTLVTIAAGFGAMASVLKLFGILRWLVLMPFLGDSYLDSSSSAATRETVAIVYNAFNKYAGGIGEVLGVTLFSGLWTALIAVVIIRSKQLPAWLGWLGLAAAAIVLSNLLEVYGVDLGPILTISGVAWQLWMVVTAIVLFVTRPKPQAL